MKNNNIKFRNFYYPLIYIVSAILIEIGTFVALGFGVFPKYFLFDIAIMLSFFGIIFISSNKIAQLIITILFLGLQIVISYVNVTLFNIYGDLFSMDMLVISIEAFKSFDSSFLNYWFLLYVLVILGLDAFLMIKDIKNKISIKLSVKTAIVLIAVFIGMQGAAVGGYIGQFATLTENIDTTYDKYFNNDKNLYNSLFIKTESLKKFGTFGFYSKNISNMIMGNSESSEDYDATKEYIKSNSMNIENEKTGSLYGDNLIVIMCESMEWFAMDPITTPTLYKLFNEGITLSNYVSKSKTNYSEMDAVLGCVPSNNSFTNSFHGSSSALLNNTLPFTLPSKFKNVGYESVKFFHDNDGNFYGRNKTHKTFGFDKVVALENMDFSNYEGAYKGSGYERDSDMIKACINEIAPTDESFLSFITTVTTHGPYKENSRLSSYYKELENGKYNEFKQYLKDSTDFIVPTNSHFDSLLKYYKAAFMDLDRGVEYLINYLVENNLMQNTSLVMFSDHNAYYQELSYELRGFDKKIYYNPDLYRVPAVIYSTKLGNSEIKEFTCPYNLAPTIFDLFGISYNTGIYMAPSIYDENFDKTIFISQIGGMMQDGLYSDNIETIFVLKDDITDEKIYNFKQSALNFYVKQDWVNKMYNLNIFKYYPELLNFV